QGFHSTLTVSFNLRRYPAHSKLNIPRGANEHADLLAKSAAQGLSLPSEVFFETIKAPSVDLLERAVLNISPVYSEDWRTEIILQKNSVGLNKQCISISTNIFFVTSRPMAPAAHNRDPPLRIFAQLHVCTGGCVTTNRIHRNPLEIYPNLAPKTIARM
ncbi:hypothetical protein ACJX0J_019919, partial [Zea mays]